MRTKPSLLCSAALGVVCMMTGGLAQAAPAKKHHHRHHEAPAAAPADSGLKTEVQELRDEVEALKSQLAAQSAATQQTAAAAQTAQAQAQQAATQAQAVQAQVDDQIKTIPVQVDTAIEKAKPANGKAYFKGVTVTMGGFAAAEGVYRSHDETADIGSAYQKIPFANDRAGHTGEIRGTARQSRYSILVQGMPNPNVTASFYGEFDFLGAAQTANSNESNSYQPRIRNLYAQLDTKDGWHLLAGDSWSLATLTANGITPRSEMAPATIDAQYVPGFVWARQPQVRITKDFNKQLWIALSAENPQTTFGATNVASGVTATVSQAPTSQYFSGTNYSLNSIPDFIGKVAYESTFAGHLFHVEGFGIYRSYLDRVTYAPTATNQAGLLGLSAGNYSIHSHGGGGGGSVVFSLFPKVLDLQGSVIAGEGIGRYGSGQLPDVATRADGQLAPIPETMWLVGATLHATKALDVYAYGGQERELNKKFIYAQIPGVFGYGSLPTANNAGCLIEGGSCSALNKNIWQVTAGFWDKIYSGSLGKVMFGMQYSHTERQAFADAAGIAPVAKEDMVFTSFRYYPF